MRQSSFCNVGIDAIKCFVSRDDLVNDSMCYPKKNPILHINKKGNGTEIVLVVPRSIREKNIIAFGISDFPNLDIVIQKVNRILKSVCNVELYMLCVTGVEVCVTIEFLKTRADEKAIMELLSRVLLSEDENKPQNKYCIGKRKKNCMVIKDDVIQSFQTKVDSCKRFLWKVYIKSKSDDENSILRIECRYNQRGIKHALKKEKGENIYVTDILQEESIIKLIKQFQKDYTTCIFEQTNDFLDEAKNLMLNDLMSGIKPNRAILKHMNEIKYDFGLVKRAVQDYYEITGKSKGSEKTRVSRLRTFAQENDLPIAKGTIRIMKQIKQAVDQAV